MRKSVFRGAMALAFALTLYASPSLAQVDFGDDASRWANDGECDDPRFEGPGMTTTPLLQQDTLHDATDCREAYEAGTITLIGEGGSADKGAANTGSANIANPAAGGAAAAATDVDFGDDSSRWANDGECDDPRFEGPGMTTTPLLQQDTLHDATDCREAFEAGTITLIGADDGDGGDSANISNPDATKPDTGASAVNSASVDFGDDKSRWANDGECDDPRFEGPGMTTTPLLEEDAFHDATDCREAFEAGTITLVAAGGSGSGGDTSTSNNAAAVRTVNFGDDASRWANDDECDDPRFEGPGMTATTLLADDILHDATDCRVEYERGRLSLVGVDEENGWVVDFGDDKGRWANDDECDDPRFEGPGMTATTLLAEDIMHDATDCRVEYERGRLTLR